MKTILKIKKKKKMGRGGVRMWGRSVREGGGVVSFCHSTLQQLPPPLTPPPPHTHTHSDPTFLVPSLSLNPFVPQWWEETLIFAHSLTLARQSEVPKRQEEREESPSMQLVQGRRQSAASPPAFCCQGARPL